MNVKKNIIPISGLAISVLAIVVTVGLDLWRNYNEITLTVTESSVLLTGYPHLKKLGFSYGGQAVTSLSASKLELTNVGNTDIVKTDIVSPVSITVTSGELYDVLIDDKDPSNLNVNVAMKAGAAYIELDLFNSGDTVALTALTSEEDPVMAVNARIKGLDKIEYIDRKGFLKFLGRIDGTVYFIGFLQLAGIGYLVELLRTAPRREKELAAVKKGETPLHNLQSTREISKYVNSQLDFLSETDRNQLRKSVAQSQPLDSGKVTALEALFVSKINEDDATESIATTIIMLVWNFGFLYKYLFA